MIKKVKATLFEKIIFFFLIILASVTLSSYFVIKNKCLFVKNYNPKNINFEKPENIAILNAPCGNVIIELYPNVSPKGVERFKNQIPTKWYIDIVDKLLCTVDKDIVLFSDSVISDKWSIFGSRVKLSQDVSACSNILSMSTADILIASRSTFSL